MKTKLKLLLLGLLSCALPAQAVVTGNWTTDYTYDGTPASTDTFIFQVTPNGAGSQRHFFWSDIVTAIDARYDTFAELDAVVADKALVNKADGAVWLGVHDFGGATSVEIPSANSPTADAVGEIAWDANDYALEVFDGTNARLIPSTRFFSATIIQPADVQPNIDAVPILPVEAYWAPFGITLLHVGIKTNSSSSLTVNFEEWVDPCDAAPSTIESVATSTSYEAIDDGELTDAAIAAGSIIYADLDTTDVNSLQIWGTYYINDGD